MARKKAPTALDILRVTNERRVALGRSITCGELWTAIEAAYGEPAADSYAGAECRRTARHHLPEAGGKDHTTEVPRGLMSKAQRAAQKAARKAAAAKRAVKVAKVLTRVIDGVTYTLTPVGPDFIASPKVAAKRAARKARVTKPRSAKQLANDKRLGAMARARNAARRTTVVPAAPAKRVVAAPAKVTRRARR